MQYTKVTLSHTVDGTYLEDLLLQGLGDLGFETFDGKDAYIQTELLDQEAVNNFIFDFNTQYGTIVSVIAIEDVPDQNWNSTWEEEHPMEELPDGVKIVPHCAFGAGHHETTGMMIEHIMRLRDEYAAIEKDGSDESEAPMPAPFAEETVLDNGCGTGVLGIYAAKYGAHVTAVDIDDKSVINTKENAALNGVEIDARLGNVPPEGQYSLILSNIHRNILLEQMPLYAQYLVSGGLLYLSGFYESDIKPLVDAAEAVGLRWEETDSRGEWCMLCLSKPCEETEKMAAQSAYQIAKATRMIWCLMLPGIVGLIAVFVGISLCHRYLYDNQVYYMLGVVASAIIGFAMIGLPYRIFLRRKNRKEQ